MLTEYKAIEGQSFFDICLLLYGSLDKAVKLANDSNITDMNLDSYSGVTFYYDATLTNNVNQQTFLFNSPNGTNEKIEVPNLVRYTTNLHELFYPMSFYEWYLHVGGITVTMPCTLIQNPSDAIAYCADLTAMARAAGLMGTIYYDPSELMKYEGGYGEPEPTKTSSYGDVFYNSTYYLQFPVVVDNSNRTFRFLLGIYGGGGNLSKRIILTYNSEGSYPYHSVQIPSNGSVNVPASLVGNRYFTISMNGGDYDAFNMSTATSLDPTRAKNWGDYEGISGVWDTFKSIQLRKCTFPIFNIPYLPSSLIELGIADCGITSLNRMFDGNNLLNLKKILIAANQITSTDVDNIFNDFNSSTPTHPTSSGGFDQYMQIQNQTPPLAPPTSASLAARNALTADGYTILTD